MVCWHSESFPLLLLMVLTNHNSLSQQLKCNYSTRPDAIIDVKTALVKGMKSLAPFYRHTKEECLSECCSDLPIKGEYPCNFMTFAPLKTDSPNCYLFYCSDKDACPTIDLNGYISYVIENDQVNGKALDMSVRKLHSQSGEKSSENGIPSDIKTLAPGLSSSRITTNFLPQSTIHSRTKQPTVVTTFKVPTVLLTTSSTETTSSTPVTTTQLPVTTTSSVTTRSTATTTLLNSFLLTSAKTVPTTVFPITQSTPTRTAALPTTLPMTSTTTQTITSVTTKPLTTLQTTPKTTTTLPTTLQTTTTQPVTTTLPTTLQTTTTQPVTTTLPTTLQTTTTQPVTTTLPTTLQTTTTQPVTTTLPTTLQITTTQPVTTTLPTTLQATTTQPVTTTLPTTLQATTTQPVTTTLPTTLQTTTHQSTMTTTLPTTSQTTTIQPTMITTLLTHPQTSTTTLPTATTTLPTTTTTQTTPLPKTQPMTTIFLPTTDLTTTTITTASTRKLIPNVTQQSTVDRIPVAKTPFFSIITVASNNGNSNKKDDGEKDHRHNLGGQNESAGKMEDSQMEIKGGLIAALLFGLLFLTIVVIILSKQVIESFNRRHYTKMDFLMNGMYVDA